MLVNNHSSQFFDSFNCVCVGQQSQFSLYSQQARLKSVVLCCSAYYILITEFFKQQVNLMKCICSIILLIMISPLKRSQTFSQQLRSKRNRPNNIQNHSEISNSGKICMMIFDIFVSVYV